MKNRRVIYGISFIGATIGALLIFVFVGIYPFGEQSIFNWDLGIQYADFFAYYKKALLGEASWTYSLSKSLGGPMISLIGYYLLSPFNLLIVFFKQEQFQEFILLISVLKMGTCGLTCSIFLKNRFRKLENLWVILISIAYALMQYNITQVTNIMWLDGVYMLPILMLAVWRYISEKKKVGVSVAVAVCILFNWYTGYMNCLFIVLYYLYEQVCRDCSCKIAKIRNIVKKFLVFCVYEGMGVLLISIVFLPIIIGLRNGKGGFSLDIFTFATNGSIIDVLRGFLIGSETTAGGNISLFCGTLFGIGGILYFLNTKIKRSDKICSGIFLGIMICSYLFKPLENVWNGFRYAYSFFCRFSYLIIVVILYLAAANFEVWKGVSRKKYLILVNMCILVFLVLNYITPFERLRLWFGIIILLAMAGVGVMRNQAVGKQLLTIIVLGELILNGVLIESKLYLTSYQEYKEYVVEQNRLINSIEEREKESFYRIEQTKKRGAAEGRLSAHLDESLAYGNRGISHYSSAFDYITSKFVANMGYSDVEDLTIYNEPILSSDSLLGVKYLLSDIPFSGWSKGDGYDRLNDKDVYYNPYALSMAFKSTGTLKSVEQNENPFIYQNNIYSSLLGKTVEIFKKAECSTVLQSDGVYVNISSGNCGGILYGYGRFWTQDLKIFIDNEYRCDYQKWLSYLIFDCGSYQEEHSICFQGSIWEEEPYEIEFYYLDMELFNEVIQELKNMEAEIVSCNDGDIQLSCNADTGAYLVLTIPFDKGWSAEVNGKKVKIEKAVDALCAVRLEEGENEIELKYHIQGLRVGCLISIFTAIILMTLYWKQKKIQNKGD